MYEAQLTLKSNQAALCWSKWQIHNTKLKLLQSMHWKFFHPYVKFLIVWIPFEMTGF